ncbi:hypothetical protein ZWY2020_056153 [Hordeum vulgare]|nr:hypothetical protein ZWY2020_056153 [Hordeum vulgare]
MSCRRRISGVVLVFALLFSPLLTPYLPTACARHVVALDAKDGLKIGGGRHRQHVVGDDEGKVVPVATASGSRPVRRWRCARRGGTGWTRRRRCTTC